MTGLAGFLLAKMAAARERRHPKNWYDIAFVLRHNDHGGAEATTRVVLRKFPSAIVGSVETSLLELQANFQHLEAQGSVSYASQMWENDRSLDRRMLRADAVVAVQAFVAANTSG